jgi:hypothetical protein
MLRVPSSTLSSRLRYSRFSQTLTADRFSLWPPTRIPSGCVPPCPKGELPPLPIHLLPPEWRSFCSAHVLLVLQQRAVQRRHGGLAVLAAQRFGGMSSATSSLSQSSSSLVDGFFFRPGRFAHVEERLQRLAQQLGLEAGEVHVDDLLHRLLVGELDVVEEAAAQEGVGQFLLVVRGDEDHRPVRADQLARLVDVELHAVEFAQQVVGELDVGLVDLVDQQRHRLRRR